MINRFLETDHREWDKHVHEFRFALNNSVHSSIKMTPAFLNLGRNPTLILPLKQKLENPAKSLILPPSPEVWNDRLQRLPALYDLVKRYIDEAHGKQAKYYNRNRREIFFNEGDLVMRRNHTLSSGERNFAAKLAPKSIEPCRVMKVLSPNTYIIEDLDAKKPIKIYVNDMKKYIAPRGNQPPKNLNIPENEPVKIRTRKGPRTRANA